MSNAQPTRAARQRAVAATVTVVGGTLVVGGQPATALDFAVTNTNASGPGSLADAVDQANLAGTADEITFAPGVTGTITLPGTLAISDTVNIVGPGDAVVTLTNAAGDVLYVYNGASLTISGVTIDAAAEDAIAANGAGDLALANMTISGSGGVGLNLDDVGGVTIADSEISGSQGVGARLFLVAGDVMITDSAFDDNVGSGFYGEQITGGVVVERTTADDNTNEGLEFKDVGLDLSLTDVTITDTSDVSGGSGLYLGNIDGATTLTNVDVSGSSDPNIYLFALNGEATLSGVTSTGSDSDGVRIVDSSATTAVSDSVIAGNATGVDLEFNAGGVTFERTTIDDSANAGIEMTGSNAVTTLYGVTVSGSQNTAMNVSGSTGGMNIVNSTFAENDVAQPDVILIDDTNVVFAHSTISDNSAGLGSTSQIRATNTSALVLYHTIATGSSGLPVTVDGSSSLTAANSLLPVGTGVSGSNIEVADPELEALTDNVGPTRTMRPAPGSPAIGGGDPAFSGSPDFDQRGAARVTGNVIDIGSVEVDGGRVDVADATVGEDAGSVTVTVVRSGFADGPASVTATTASGSAESGSDFTATSETLVWADGEVGDRTMSVPILADDAEEGDETFTVALTGAAGAVLGDNSATVTITDVVSPPDADAVTSLAPRRYVDTRPTGRTFDGADQADGKLAAGGEIEFEVAGRGDVPADAVGVIMNVTAVQAEGIGFVTAHPCVTPRPLSSSLNYTAGVNLGNEIVAGLSSDGTACLYTSEAAHLTVDVVGYVSATSPVVNVTPARLLDTRAGRTTIDGKFAGGGITGAGSTTIVEIAGRDQIPTDASAVIVNVTAVRASDTGFVTVSGCVDPLPTASSLNYVAGVNRGNELIASLDADGQICLFTSTSVHLTVDIVGYIPAGSTFAAVEPARLLDSRSTGRTIDSLRQREGKWKPAEQQTLQVTGRGEVPDGARAAVVNVTAVQAEGVGFVTVHPCLDTLPLASSLNYVAGVNGGNEIIARLDDDGQLCLFTSQSTHITVDVVGYLT